MIEYKDRWLSARTRFYVGCQKVDMKQALVMARGDWDYMETEELRSRLQEGETVTVRGKFGKRKTFSLRLIEASLGVRFLCASHGPSVMWNSDTANDWLSNLRIAA